LEGSGYIALLGTGMLYSWRNRQGQFFGGQILARSLLLKRWRSLLF